MSAPSDRAPSFPEDIFNDALPLDHEGRARLLAERCGEDADLRREIERMLAIADREPELLRPPVESDVPEQLGNYRILSELGRGGMGIVYLARDVRLGRLVALKVLPRWLDRDEHVERFEREARLLASLNHDRIATLYSLETDGMTHFLTMEHVEGESLDRVIATRGVLTVPAAISCCAQIAEGLAAAHARGIIHRDLKPANVIVTRGGSVKVLDFGIAKALGAIPSAAAHAGAPPVRETDAYGTPAYMSPEQHAGRRVDHRTDLWALGCVLFECLTGRRAFPEGSAGEAGSDPCRSSLDLSLLPRGTPGAVRALIGACLDADPSTRPASAEDVVRVLTRAKLTLVRRVRRRAVRIAVAVVGALVVALAVSSLSGRGRGSPLASVEVTGRSTVRAVDARGRSVWVRRLPAKISRNDRHGRSAPQTLVPSGGVLLATSPGLQPAALWYLDERDGSTVWTHIPAWTPPVNAHGPLLVTWTALVSWPGRDAPVLAIGLGDGAWYPGAVQFLTFERDLLGTYYHPGPLWLEIEVQGPSGRPRLLFWGINSSARFDRRIVPFETEHHLGCVAMLEPPNVDGQAFPHATGIAAGRDWLNAPRAAECGYLLLPPVHPDEPSYIKRVTLTREGGERRFEIELEDGRVFFTDAELRPLSYYVVVGLAADHVRRQSKDDFPPCLYLARGVEHVIAVPELTR